MPLLDLRNLVLLALLAEHILATSSHVAPALIVIDPTLRNGSTKLVSFSGLSASRTRITVCSGSYTQSAKILTPYLRALDCVTWLDSCSPISGFLVGQLSAVWVCCTRYKGMMETSFPKLATTLGKYELYIIL